MNSQYLITFNERAYRFNLEKLNEWCFKSKDKENAEREITEAYDFDEDGEFHLTSKINREITSPGDSQDDMLMYDFIKLLIVKALDVHTNIEVFEPGFILAVNTLIFYGILEEITI